MDVAKELEKRFLPLLQTMAKEIEAEFPHVKTKVQSYPVGTLTEFQGYSIGLECCLPDVSGEQTDNIALEITLKHINTKPEISSVDICWGHPGFVELSIAPDGIECNDQVFNDLEKNIPTLIDVLKEAIERGHPPEDYCPIQKGDNGRQKGFISKESIIIGGFLSWIIAIVLVFVIFGPKNILDGSKAFNWQKQVCTVEETKFDQQQADKPALLVKVRYEFEGHPYKSTCRLTSDSQEHLRRQAELFFRPGDDVDCRINPANPVEIMLDKEYMLFEFFLILSVLMTVICIIVSLVLLWMTWTRKSRRASRFRFIVRKAVLLFCCGFVVVFGGGATIFGVFDAIRMLGTLSWTQVEATIKSSSVSEVREGNSWNYKCNLRYVYEFEGKQYEGDRWSLFDEEVSTKRDMRKALDGLKPGDIVPCYINPKNPVQAILERQARSFAVLLVLPFLVAIVAYFFWHTLREKDKDSEPTVVEAADEPAISPLDLNTITQLPFHLQYELNRRQRFVPHCKLWLPYMPVMVIMIGGTFLAVVDRSWWYLPLFLVAIWFSRAFFIGLIEVILHRKRWMDIVVEENCLGFLAKGERWWLFLDGILRIEKFCKHAWTIYHCNGTVINIRVAAITDEQVAYLKAAAKKGRDSEQIKAIIERGKKIEQLM